MNGGLAELHGLLPPPPRPVLGSWMDRVLVVRQKQKWRPLVNYWKRVEAANAEAADEADDN